MADNELTCATAIAYADLGWPVLPIWGVRNGRCACGKPDCRYPGKHPHGGLVPHGLKQATTDKQTIRSWFGNGNGLNLAVATGPESALVAIDIDPRHDGNRESLGPLPDTACAATGGNGWHLFFAYPPGTEIDSYSADKKPKPKLGPGVDVKALGGYIILPPSRHISGGQYKWLRDPRGGIAKLPEAILQKIVREPIRAKRAQQLPAGDDDKTKTIARECLKLLGSARADNYDDWLLAGMACRQSGLSCDEWDQWSQQSAKYQAGEPERKWETFATARQDTVGAGSLIFWAAQDQGISTAELLARIAPDFHLTDAGNAERFGAAYSHCLRYVRDWGRWVYFDGARWNPQTGGEQATQAAIAMARSMLVQAGRTADEGQRSRLAKWALQSESAARVQAALSLAEKLPPVAIAADDLDRDAYLLNVANGTIDLRTGTLRPHNPADMLTKMSPVEYEPGARLESWDNHLLRVAGGDRGLVDFIQMGAGYSATGDISEEVLFLIHGPTAGGKTTTIEAIKAALGDYACTTDFETFLKRNQVGGIRNDIARLAGARLVVSVEVDEGKQLAEGLVKMLTGGYMVSARFLHQEYFEFRPQCKLWLICNDAPRANDTDDALWRRIIRVPFEHSIPKEERDPQVKARLKDPAAGGPAVLAWIVEGCAKWKKSGLIVPLAIERATQAYRESQDPLREFFDDRCIFQEGATVSVKALRATYQAHAEENGIRYPLGPREFNRRLEARGCRRATRKCGGEKIKCWLGLLLAPATETEIDESADSTQFDDGMSL